MANINYIVSDHLDYEKLICNDAGPGYAESMHWKTVKLNSLKEFSPYEIYVIDNRIEENECAKLTCLFQENPKIIFIVKIVDPYFEHSDHFFYKWIKNSIGYKNIRLLSVYEPKELTALFSKSLSKPIIYIPYPYDASKELPLKKLKQRKNKLIIAGSINKIIYPYRSKIWAKTRRSISRFFFNVLKHPGYQEITNLKPGHNLIAGNFILHLSKFKFMLLCSSRCRIEFLKFHECAYAGCLPVGEFPTCFPDDIKLLFKIIDMSNLFFSAASMIFNWSEKKHLETIEKYRTFLKTTRHYEVLNKSFIQQLG